MKIRIVAAEEKAGDYLSLLVECVQGEVVITKKFLYGGVAEKVSGKSAAVRYSAAKFCKEARRDLAVAMNCDIRQFDNMNDGAEVQLIAAVLGNECA